MHAPKRGERECQCREQAIDDAAGDRLRIKRRRQRKWDQRAEEAGDNIRHDRAGERACRNSQNGDAKDFDEGGREDV